MGGSRMGRGQGVSTPTRWKITSGIGLQDPHPLKNWTTTIIFVSFGIHNWTPSVK